MRRRRSKKTTYAFIDSQNLNLGVQRMGWKMDWRRFRQFLQEEHNVSRAFMFIGYMSENESLYEYMHELGYLVVLKPTVDVLGSSDSSGASDEQREKAIKGNVDTELVLYAMKELPNYTRAIIVSGDGDFYSLAEFLEEKGKLASIMTPNWQYSSLLKAFDSKLIRLDQLRKKLAYHDYKKKSAKNTNPKPAS